MNQRANVPVSARSRRTQLLLSLLLPILAVQVAQSTAPPLKADGGYTTPYLHITGPPPLRFQEPAPPPEASASPLSAGSRSIDGNAKPVIVRSPGSGASASGLPGAPEAPTRSDGTAPGSPPATPPNPNGPPPLLPDDGGAKVKPEDFLPFFQFPEGGRNESAGTVPVPPKPGTLPPSSANYQQQ